MKEVNYVPLTMEERERNSDHEGDTACNPQQAPFFRFRGQSEMTGDVFHDPSM